MKMIYFFFTLFVILSMTDHADAQSDMTFHFGPAIPLSEFADDNIYNSDNGLAGLGLGAGLAALFPLNDNGLNIFAGVDILFNPMNGDAKDEIEDGYEDSDFTFPKYFNLPLSAGLQYNYEVDTDTKLYAKLGLAFSLTKYTNFKWEEPDDDDYVESYELSTGFGFVFGAGAVLNEKIELGLTYMGLGNHQFEGKAEYGEDTDKIDDFERLINILNLTVGFRLN